MQRNVLGIVGIAFVSAGCADWPRSQNIPSNDGSTPATDALGDLIDVDWTIVDESVDADGDDDGNDTISETASTYGTGELARGFGFAVRGALATTGWNKEMVRPSLTEGESCASAPLDALNIDDGFYIGDLDFYTLTIADGATEPSPLVLCASVQSDDERLGWDLLLVTLNGCDVAPVVSLEPETGVPLGYGLGGATGTWTAPVEPGETYALMYAGYTLPSGEDEEVVPVSYQLGATLVRPSEGSTMTICPSLPTTEGDES